MVSNYNNLPLPLTMNPAEYGEIRGTFNIDGGVRYFIDNNYLSFEIDVCGNTNTVRIKGGVDLRWVDTLLDNNTFSRVINKNTLYIKDGEVIVKSKQLNAKAFKTVNVDKKLSTTKHIMTIDIETINIEGILHPYLICGYNPKNSIVSYADSVSDDGIHNMFTSFIHTLISLKHISDVYAHNLSGFDGIFLLKQLIKYNPLKSGQIVKVDPLIHNGKIISIKFSILESFLDEKTNKMEQKTVRSILFKDSLLLLPMSLRKLCKSFSVDLVKGYFPVLYNDDINYIGPLPHFTYWTDINFDEWLELYNKNGDTWSFKDEAIKYCMLDCKSLFQVLVKFNELVFGEFKLNVFDSLTLPSLAMNIYKSSFMPKDTLYQLHGIIDEDIRESYTGGAVDVFIPHNYNIDTDTYSKLYYYDVNSLYPFVMSTLTMPVGKPTTFSGNIRSINPNAQGFFYCDITSPEYLEHPILQRRIKTSSGMRTIAGLGSWIGWISSLEYDNAIDMGYKIQILKGYTFDKANIFKEYVERMYNLRLQYKPGDPMNLIAKLLMNSLYGKFGMKPEKSIVQIFNTEVSDELEVLNSTLEVWGETVSDHIQIDNHVIIVRKNMSNVRYDEEQDLFHGSDINIAIASMITAGARMYMGNAKNNPDFKLYYSDTDSIVIDQPLPDKMVGKELGLFKLEHEISRAVFLAPKVYGFINTDGEEVIKVKGISKPNLANVHLSDLSKLLVENSRMEFTQDKWFKKIISGDITIHEVGYQLKVTSNKRAPIYINGIYSNTRPYNYSELE